MKLDLQETLTLFVGDSPAKTLVLQEKGLDSLAHEVDFSTMLCVSQRIPKQKLSSWRMSRPGLLSSNQGRDFGVLLTALAESGYSNIEWRVLDSQFFGVPQRRRRIFIVASVGTKPFRQILSLCESSTGDSQESQQTGQDTARTTSASTRTSGIAIIGGQHPNAAIGIDISPTLTSAMGLGGGHTPIMGVYGESSFAGYKSGVGTLRTSVGALGGGSDSLVVQY